MRQRLRAHWTRQMPQRPASPGARAAAAGDKTGDARAGSSACVPPLPGRRRRRGSQQPPPASSRCSPRPCGTPAVQRRRAGAGVIVSKSSPKLQAWHSIPAALRANRSPVIASHRSTRPPEPTPLSTERLGSCHSSHLHPCVPRLIKDGPHILRHEVHTQHGNGPAGSQGHRRQPVGWQAWG